MGRSTVSRRRARARNVGAHRKERAALIVLAAGFLALAAASPASAQSVWDGSVSTDWNTAGNWNTNAVPTNADNAVVDDVSLNTPNITGVAAQANVITVGDSNSGITLAIQSGGTLATTGGLIGNTAGSGGAVSAQGIGSSWSNSGDLHVAVQGNGQLTLFNGAQASADDVFLADGAAANGSVSVDGAGSSFTLSGNLTLGISGAGTLGLFNGGQASNVDAVLGVNAGSAGVATVTGISADWQNSGSLSVGVGGIGNLTISAGGEVSSAQAVLGNSATGFGVVTVTGAGSKWSNASDFVAGYDGQGTIVISNGGEVASNNGAGLLDLASHIGSFGTLSIGNGSTAGTLSASLVQFGDGTGTINFDHTDTGYVFAADLSWSGPQGTASINQIAGETILTGDGSGFDGTTTISGGRLAVNNALGGTINVLAGGELGGVGTLGAVTANAGGTVAPGNSIGTLHVASLTFAPGSLYEVEVDPLGNSDLTQATGSATINGGTVSVLAQAGSYGASTQYTIVNAGGGVSGVFDNVTSNFAFLDPSLSYDANNVYLTLTQNMVGFADVAETPNQEQAAAAAEELGAGNAIYDSLVGLSASDAQAAFDQLTGEIHASITSTLLSDSRFLRDTAIDRLRAAYAATAADDAPVFAASDGGIQTASATTERLAIWGQAFGSWGERDGDGNAGGLDRDTGGFLAGADAYLIDNWRFGVLAGYSRTAFDVDSRDSSGDSDNYHVGVYGGSQWGDLGLRFGAAYTWHDIDTRRSVSFGAFSDTLSADYDAGTVQAFGEIGHQIHLRDVSLEPFANLAYVNVDTDGYSEHGDEAALHGAGADADLGLSTIGIRAATGFTIGDLKATARGALGWRHAFGDTTPDVVHEFSGGDDFQISGVPLARDAATLKAGLDLELSESATLGLAYDGAFSDDSQEHGVLADFTLKF